MVIYEFNFWKLGESMGDENIEREIKYRGMMRMETVIREEEEEAGSRLPYPRSSSRRVSSAPVDMAHLE